MGETHRIPGLVLTDLDFRVPLDYTDPGGEQIDVFARSAVAPGKEHADLPWLVFFQGGPGSQAPRPEAPAAWLKRAVQDYRVLLLDQRGTGRSSPATAQTLARLRDPQAQADYLKHFRADNIVRDAEHIRVALLGAHGRWSVLGQSFGGFCAVRYLSAAPEGLAEVFITGGLPPLDRTAEDIYRATYRRVAGRNRRFYHRYPEDAARTATIAAYLTAHDVRLPAGGRLSPRHLQQLGIAFGMSDGFESVHYLLEGAFVEGANGPELSHRFLAELEGRLSFERDPLYVLLHEAEYCQEAASNWAAERVRSEYPEFDVVQGEPFYFTGEMVYPWMLEEYPQLAPLKDAAELLASYTDWPRLYDPAALATNRVPCAALIYYDDMYVEREFSEATAAAISGLRVWITNEYDHNGLRADGERILDRLIAMVHGNV